MDDSGALTAVEIQENLATVRARMATAAVRAGRQPDDVRLVAVSKQQPFAAIEAAYAAGQRDFGENRFDELWSKVAQGRQAGLHDMRWHFIGSIQSRKTQQAVGPLALIHSVDRAKIAQRLSRDATAAACVLQVLLEVNVSGEVTKHGFTPGELTETLPELLALPGMRIQGLMTMAPYTNDARLLRNVFHALRTLRDELQAANAQAELPELSMGMTNDYESAIEEGATLVRIGSAIFSAPA